MNRRTLWFVFAVLFVIAALLDGLLLTPHDLEEKPWLRIPGFFALFGLFGGMLFAVAVKQWLHHLVQRGEGYYDE